MCNFLSGIVLPTGEVITSDYTDSHDDIVDSVGLRDDGRLPGHEAFAPVEFTSDTPLDAESYGLSMDDDTARPDWFTDEMWASVDAELHERIRRMIITSGTRKILLGGTWLLGGDVTIERTVGARIITMQDSSQVGEMLGSSQVGEMLGSSQVGTMRDSSQVAEMWEYSRVGTMRDSSRVISDYREKK